MNKSINKLLKPIKAFLAIILTVPAIYLPFCLQNVYKRAMSLLAYKLKNYKFIADSVIIQKEEYDEGAHNGKEK
jgi:hypothetical protein